MLPLVPPAGSVRRQRPSLHRVLRGEFPGFHGTMALCDALRPSRRTRLPSPDNTLRRACRFAPGGPGRPTAGLGFVTRSPLPGKYAGRLFRASQVPEESLCAYALLSDPGRTDSPGHTTLSARPPLCPRRRLPRLKFFRGSITRPLHSLSTLRQVPRDTRRKTRFPLLATLRDGIGYPQDSIERLRVASYISSSLPKLAWRNVASFYLNRSDTIYY